MARRGRKRKIGVREPNGQLQRATRSKEKSEDEVLQELIREDEAAKRAEQRAMRDTVLAQPHRRGSEDPRSESPLGRLCRAHGLDKILQQAGEKYAEEVFRYRRGWGMRSDINPPPDTPGLRDPDYDGPTWVEMNAINGRIRSVNVMLVRRSTPTYLSVYRITILQRDVAPEWEEATIQGLAILARAYGMMQPDHPFR